MYCFVGWEIFSRSFAAEAISEDHFWAVLGMCCYPHITHQKTFAFYKLLWRFCEMKFTSNYSLGKSVTSIALICKWRENSFYFTSFLSPSIPPRACSQAMGCPVDDVLIHTNFFFCLNNFVLFWLGQ